MTLDARIIRAADWQRTGPGSYLLEWEQQQLDRAVADMFGFHAMQLGMPALQGLRHNRMKHRWLALDEAGVCALDCASEAAPQVDPGAPPAPAASPDLQCEFEALPLPSQSVDLLVMPHTLDLAQDAHQVLREAERVLVPDGKVVIAGFNPASLWALRRRALPGAHWIPPSAAGEAGAAPELIGYWRLRDWLKLLSFEVQAGCFGCYRPLMHSPQWFARMAWMDKAGDRWWPVFGAVYFLVAVKRVRGMHLVGRLRKVRKAPATATAVVTHRGH